MPKSAPPPHKVLFKYFNYKAERLCNHFKISQKDYFVYIKPYTSFDILTCLFRRIILGKKYFTWEFYFMYYKE